MVCYHRAFISFFRARIYTFCFFGLLGATVDSLLTANFTIGTPNFGQANFKVTVSVYRRLIAYQYVSPRRRQFGFCSRKLINWQKIGCSFFKCTNIIHGGGFRMGRSSSTHFGRKTVGPGIWEWYCFMATSSPVHLFKHVKHGTQTPLAQISVLSQTH